MLSNSDSTVELLLHIFSDIEESFVVLGESFICMSNRTRRFVRPDSCVGYLSIYSYLGSCRFVCRYVESYRFLSIFVSVLFVGISCRKLISMSESEVRVSIFCVPLSVMNEKRVLFKLSTFIITSLPNRLN